MKIIGVLVVSAVLCFPAETPRRDLSVQELLEQKLMQRIHAIDDSLDGVLGVAIIDLSSGHTVSWHGDTTFPQASSIKMPILAQMFRAARQGRLELSKPVTLQPSDTVGGSGHLKLMLRLGPVTITPLELARAMIETSDNTATNRLISLVGMENVNALMSELGFPNTRLRRIMIDSEAAAQNNENVSTPIEMARFVELIYRGKAVDADASRSMLEIMKLVNAGFRAAVPTHVAVASKPGAVNGVRCETGVVLLERRPFVLSVMSTYLGEDSNPIPKVAGLVYQHFEKLAASNIYGNRVR